MKKKLKDQFALKETTRGRKGWKDAAAYDQPGSHVHEVGGDHDDDHESWHDDDHDDDHDDGHDDDHDELPHDDCANATKFLKAAKAHSLLSHFVLSHIKTRYIGFSLSWGLFLREEYRYEYYEYDWRANSVTAVR